MVGELIADRYELEELVGSGGMSSVYKARDTLLERNVALKILHPHYTGDDEYVRRFRHEARAAAQLSHPNIVTVIDRGEENGRQFIVFEYVEGETLKDLIDRTGPLPLRDTVELALCVARGLAFAHAQGLVHRDVKPQNVLLSQEGETKVTDFGIARSLDVEHGLTQTGTVLGTSNYIAPEQASGRQVTEQTDVYSLGVVLYELLTGEVPFPGDNFVAVAMRHINEPAPSVLERRPETPLRLAAVVERAMEKDPARRFPSMSAFCGELERCLDELTGHSVDGAATAIVRSPVLRESRARPMRAGRRHRWPLVFLALAALAAAAALAVFLLGGSSSPRGGTKSGGAAGAAISLAAVSGYDPEGTGGEHDGDAHLATDGNTSTAWSTEHYRSQDFGGLKHGVGLVVRASGTPKTLTVTTDTPGFTARILAGPSQGGSFAADSATRAVNGTTTFRLNGATGPYFVVWITSLPPSTDHADVAEVGARG